MQYRLNITHDYDMKHDHFVRDESCTDPERRLGGDRWPELTLKITSSIGNKQLSSTPSPGKYWTPFVTKKYSVL